MERIFAVFEKGVVHADFVIGDAPGKWHLGGRCESVEKCGRDVFEMERVWVYAFFAFKGA